MKVKQAKPGEIIEILDGGGTVASGRFYKISRTGHTEHAVRAWKRFNQGETNIFPDAYCRIASVDGFGETSCLNNSPTTPLVAQKVNS